MPQGHKTHKKDLPYNMTSLFGLGPNIDVQIQITELISYQYF